MRSAPIALESSPAIVAPMANTSPQALEGVTVLDLSRILAGPWASQLLGDLGATIIKIERPGAGDDTRSWGPPFAVDDIGKTTDAAYFLAANRNKRSVAIDISTREGATLIKKLAAKADILLENFKTGSLKKYGLDYGSLRMTNPRLVYCSITGFGQTGPYKDRPGYDFMIQAMGGAMSITGQPDGEPTRAGISIADLFSGMYAATAMLAALRHAERTGEGQHIDVSLFDCQISALANQASNYLISGETPQRLGNAHPNLSPYQVFETASAHIVVAVGNNTQFAEFCNAIGLPALATDPRFQKSCDRIANRETLVPLIAKQMKQKTSAIWLEMFEGAGVPAGPINTIDEAFKDPQAIARKMTVELNREGEPPQNYTPHPVKYSRTQPPAGNAPPALSADTDLVLQQSLSLSDDEIEALRKQGVIG